MPSTTPSSATASGAITTGDQSPAVAAQSPAGKLRELLQRTALWRGDTLSIDTPHNGTHSIEVDDLINLLEAHSNMLAALRETEKEVGQTIADIVGAREADTMRSAHPMFDEVSQKELARLEAVAGRIAAAIAKADGLRSPDTNSQSNGS